MAIFSRPVDGYRIGYIMKYSPIAHLVGDIVLFRYGKAGDKREWAIGGVFPDIATVSRPTLKYILTSAYQSAVLALDAAFSVSMVV